MAQGSTFLQAIVSIEKIPQKDLNIIDNYLKELGITEKQFSIFRRVNALAKMM
jgi:hypothetical protein